MKNIFTVLILAFSISGHAEPITQKPILIGAGGSLVTIRSPLSFSTNSGSYLPLEGALYRKGFLVTSEAVGGSATFGYTTCLFGPCVHFDSYQEQFDKGLGKIFSPVTLDFNADYVIFAIANDCVHSLIYPVGSSPCVTADYNQMVDTLVSVGQQACALGLTPIYDEYMEYGELNIGGFLAFGAVWVIDEAGWNEMATIHRTRILQEVSCALQVDIWDNFNDLGDGIHPDETTSKKAAKAIKTAIAEFEAL